MIWRFNWSDRLIEDELKKTNNILCYDRTTRWIKVAESLFYRWISVYPSVFLEWLNLTLVSHTLYACFFFPLWNQRNAILNKHSFSYLTLHLITISSFAILWESLAFTFCPLNSTQSNTPLLMRGKSSYTNPYAHVYIVDYPLHNNRKRKLCIGLAQDWPCTHGVFCVR